jgi:hypothetical protein
MSRFIVADITKPQSTPFELELTVPNYMIPLVPIIEKPHRPFAMFQDLWKKYSDSVLPPLYYDSGGSTDSRISQSFHRGSEHTSEQTPQFSNMLRRISTPSVDRDEGAGYRR